MNQKVPCQVCLCLLLDPVNRTDNTDWWCRKLKTKQKKGRPFFRECPPSPGGGPYASRDRRLFLTVGVLLRSRRHWAQSGCFCLIESCVQK